LTARILKGAEEGHSRKGIQTYHRIFKSPHAWFVEYIKGPRLDLEFTFAEPVFLSHEKNEILLKEESFPPEVRYNELDFQCRHILSKAGRKELNPIITVIVIGFPRW